MKKANSIERKRRQIKGVNNFVNQTEVVEKVDQRRLWYHRLFFKATNILEYQALFL